MSTLCGKKLVRYFKALQLSSLSGGKALLLEFAASTFCTDNLILMISGVNALSLGLLGNVVCDRFRLAWFVTQAL